MTILDKTLLYLLEKARKISKDEIKSFEDGIDSLYFILFLPTIPLFIFCLVLLLGFTPNLDNVFNVEKTMGKFFIGAIFFAGFLILLDFLVKSRLRSIIKKHAYITSTKVEEKEIYSSDSEIALSIYAKPLWDYMPVMSVKDFFSNKELDTIKNKKIVIEAHKGSAAKYLSGVKAEISLINEDEFINLDVPEKALVYQIEKVELIKKTVQRVCGGIKDETETLKAKIFLSASIDEDMLKEIKNQKELDDLLTL
jgi:hypothetical protein